ncbi:hypothetical protein MRQ36_24700 [Micromonospora sp. R77]|uniref:hypothetical protein n=1 Tax=Micromonospora sp. R77 TaxID=2925836 RepID=UPI001F6112B8|nr:hypothetical protein [Micromonospora sp. R77]MCI4065589.1 hypothetical protein [Micromonospora sp. R77]
MTTTTDAAPGVPDRWIPFDLDAWTRYVVRRHFDPETGSPYWLKRTTELPFDPRDITAYDELAALGCTDPRGVDPVDLLPQDRPVAGRLWESTGTLGGHCRFVHTPSMTVHRDHWRARHLATAGFAPGRTWLRVCPGGPHALGRGAAQLARHHRSRVHTIGMDQRWIRRLLRDGRVGEINAYVDHVVGQVVDLLREQPVDYLETAPAILAVLLAARPDLVARLAGVDLTGTHLTPQTYRDVVAALDGGVVGHHFVGAAGYAIGLPVHDGGALMPYLPAYPQVTMAVVDPADPARVVGYGELGRIRLTVLHEDLFLPNVLQRDQALRYRTPAGWPCDGVANVAPLQAMLTLPTGLY